MVRPSDKEQDMTEYKIVCKRHQHHVMDGKEHESDGMSPSISGYGSYNIIYHDLEVAQKELEEAKKDIAMWEKKHNEEAKLSKYGVILHFSNIRLVSREVTEWADL